MKQWAARMSVKDFPKSLLKCAKFKQSYISNKKSSLCLLQKIDELQTGLAYERFTNIVMYTSFVFQSYLEPSGYL